MESTCSDWLAGLSSFDWQRESAVLQIEDGRDAIMVDGVTATPTQTISKEYDLLLQALVQHRARLNRGEVGERLVALRARLERSRAFFQKQGWFGAPVVMGPEKLTDGDTEMEGTGNTDVQETPANAIRRDIARLEVMLTQSEDNGSDIDHAETWGTARVEEEWFAQDLRSAIERISREYVSRSFGGQDAGLSAQGVSLSHGQAKLEELKQIGVDLEDIRFQCETLEKILGTPSGFDQRAVSMLPDVC